MSMPQGWRFRTTLTGKLILQRRWDEPLVGGPPYADWRDAKATDLFMLVAALEEHAESRLEKVRQEVRDYDRTQLDDPTGDGSGNEARPPDGDDYNEICSIIGAH